MKPGKSKKTDSDRKQYYLPAFLMMLIIVLGVIAFTVYGMRTDHRDFQRRAAIEEVTRTIEDFYIKNDKYPEAVFFTGEYALICGQVDCFQQQEVELKGAARSVIEPSENTTSKRTKYGYVLINGSYSLGYCDEQGEIQGFGSADDENLAMNCN